MLDEKRLGTQICSGEVGAEWVSLHPRWIVAARRRSYYFGVEVSIVDKVVVNNVFCNM